MLAITVVISLSVGCVLGRVLRGMRLCVSLRRFVRCEPGYSMEDVCHGFAVCPFLRLFLYANCLSAFGGVLRVLHVPSTVCARRSSPVSLYPMLLHRRSMYQC